MIDQEIIAESGLTKDRLRQFFTAKLPRKAKLDKMDAKERKALDREIERRRKFECMLGNWISEQVIFSLNNHTIYTAVDIAWDSMPIQKHLLPLIMYAQGRIDIRTCQTALKDVPNGDTYVRRNATGEAVSIDMPKFFETNINLIRSITTRRSAAQANKYNSLYPHFRYESRSNGMVGKLRGEMVSERMDIMADQYGYSEQEEQEIRDMFLYAHSVSFPRSGWEREVQWFKDPRPKELDDGKIHKKARVVKEGISWVNPHPTRIIWDNNYPLTAINTDSGPEYIGFWDVMRWKDIANNPEYFNRDNVGFSAETAGWFTTYSVYFNQFFDKISPPSLPQDVGLSNDRKNNVGVYSGEIGDSGAFFSDMRVKIVPRDWGLGVYPYPVWLHLKVAGDQTVVYADILPSSPAVVYSYNEKNDRLLNISVAHELMQYQDQLSNLFMHLLEACKADLFSMAILNEDIFPATDEGKKLLNEFKAIMSGKNFYASMQVLTASFSRLQELGVTNPTMDNVFKIVRSAPNTAITAIFESIAKVISMAERLMVLSSQEQGQPAPREISATETNVISGSTEAIYSFISKAIDRARAAKKRICYESFIACGEDIVTLPVQARFPDDVIQKAGFQIVTDGLDEDGGQLNGVNLTGSKSWLVHDYIFTSRDGADRALNQQTAQTLVQLIQSVMTGKPEVSGALLKAMGKKKVFEIFNEIFRLSGTGIDLRLEVKPGDSDELMIEDEQQVMQIIQRLAQSVSQNTNDLAQVKQALGLPQQAGPAAAPAPPAMAA